MGLLIGNASFFANSDKTKIVSAIFAHFKQGKGGDVSSNLLNSLIKDHSKFKDFIRTFQIAFQAGLTSGTQDGINGILKTPIELKNGPVFDDYTTGLGIILDGINYTYVTLDKYSTPYDNGYYKADITVHMVDAFGLDKNDLKRFGNFPVVGDGFKAWAMLQHFRGFLPFKIYIDVKTTIEGNVNQGLTK